MTPSSRRFLVTVPIGVSQSRISSEVAKRINRQIRSQFSIQVEDDSEINVGASISASLAIVRKQHSAFSPIMNTINFETQEAYQRQRQTQFIERSSSSTTIELDKRAIQSSKVRRPVNASSFNIWPLQLNIPQLCDGQNNANPMIKVKTQPFLYLVFIKQFP